MNCKIYLLLALVALVSVYAIPSVPSIIDNGLRSLFTQPSVSSIESSISDHDNDNEGDEMPSDPSWANLDSNGEEIQVDNHELADSSFQSLAVQYFWSLNNQEKTFEFLCQDESMEQRDFPDYLQLVESSVTYLLETMVKECPVKYTYPSMVVPSFQCSTLAECNEKLLHFAHHFDELFMNFMFILTELEDRQRLVNGIISFNREIIDSLVSHGLVKEENELVGR